MTYDEATNVIQSLQREQPATDYTSSLSAVAKAKSNAVKEKKIEDKKGDKAFAGIFQKVQK